MACILIENLVKDFGEGDVLRKINLRIDNGEFFVFVGPSGSGKSTLLRLIAGLIKPTQGDIRFDETRVTYMEASERNTAMVFQNYALYPHKNVYDNIAFGLRARKVPEQQVLEQVHKAADILGIERLLTRWPKELSGGERQRVAIGRAIVREPQVFLLDEPLSNLDAQLRIEMRNELAKLHQRLKTTFIYVTHDQIEAMTLGERIAVINEGEIEQIDTPDNLYDFPKNRFVAGFIGSPAMNLLKGKMFYNAGKGSLRLTLSENEKNVLYEGKLRKDGPAHLCDVHDVMIGIRPEAMDLAPSNRFSIPAEIVRVESIGHEGFVYLNFSGRAIVARVSNPQHYKGLRNIRFGVHIWDLHLFSMDSGEAVFNKGRFQNKS